MKKRTRDTLPIAFRVFLTIGLISAGAGARPPEPGGPPEPLPEYESVDLGPYVDANDSNFTKKYTRLPRGTEIPSLASSVPFKVFENGNKFFILLSNGESKTISFNDYTRRIYFFGHVHAWLPVNILHGKYVIRYVDGTSVDVILDGRRNEPTWNIDDHCCNYSTEPTARAPVAWRDAGQAPKPSLIREFRWDNPTPDKKILNIQFADFDQVNQAERHPMLFAITYVSYSPPPPPPTCDRHIDLSPYVNFPPSRFTKGYGRLPIDTVLTSTASGVSFKVFSSTSPESQEKTVLILADVRKPAPKIAINAAVGRLHFFGHVYRGSPSPGIQGKYVVRYVDGTAIDIELDSRPKTSGYNIDAHCCDYRTEDAGRARVAWRDSEQEPKPPLIRELAWTNPTPEKVVREIEFWDDKPKPQPMLFAITCYPPGDPSDRP